MPFIAELISAAQQTGFSLSESQVTAFSAYYQLLVEWNEKMNLTAITEPREVAVKHMIDSLSCYRADVFKEQAKVIDVGTGAGFPSLPLKIFRSDLRQTLLDSLNKRLVFLQAVIDALSLQDIALVHSRAEDFARRVEQREYYDVAVSRAVARLPVLCELCLPFVAVNGWFIALKGAQYEQEWKDSRQALKTLGGEVVDVSPFFLPGLDDKRAVIYIKKIKPTPQSFPRRAGIPEKKPL